MVASSIGWVEYILLTIAVALLIYSTYKCLLKIGDYQSPISSQGLNRNCQRNQLNRTTSPTTNSSHAPTLYSVATVVMTTNIGDSVRTSENSEHIDDLPPPYNEAIFYPITKAMVEINQQQV